jgi:hypothetical protein
VTYHPSVLKRACASAAIALAVAVPTALAVGTQAVTLNVSQYVNQNKLLTLAFSGTIESGAPGEFVDILGRDCGARNERSITSTRTVAGGRYRIDNPNPNPPFNFTFVESGTTFRSRWNDQYSDPFLWRLPLRPAVTKVSGRRAWRIEFHTRPPGIAGKPVELQRLSKGQWVRVRRARLVEKRSTVSDVLHEAVFSVPTRGLTLRVFVPAQTAAPCHLAGASKQWRS